MRAPIIDLISRSPVTAGYALAIDGLWWWIPSRLQIGKRGRRAEDSRLVQKRALAVIRFRTATLTDPIHPVIQFKWWQYSTHSLVSV